MADVFLSYASSDRDRVKPLVDALTRQGWSVWWDRRILAGASWDEAIEVALNSARCVIVVWTRAAVESEWVRIEAGIGRERDVLVPVMLDEVPIPLTFRHIQAAPLIGWDGADTAPGFVLLQAAVRRLATSAAELAPPRYVTEERALDAAMKRELPVRTPASLIAMVRRASSGGLRLLLETDDEFNLTPGDVASKPVDLTFPAGADGKALPAEVIIRVICPGFDPASQEKKIRVHPERDSAVCSFLITPLEHGQLTAQVELYQNQECIGSRILRARGLIGAAAPATHCVVTLPLVISVNRDDLFRAGRVAADADVPLAYAPAPATALPSPPPVDVGERAQPSSRHSMWARAAVAAALVVLCVPIASYQLPRLREGTAGAPPVATAPAEVPEPHASVAPAEVPPRTTNAPRPPEIMLPPSTLEPRAVGDRPRQRPAKPLEPARRPANPGVNPATSGTLVWEGEVRGGELITVNGAHVSSGTLTGRLPGRPVQIHLPEWSDIRVTTSPSPSNGWRTLQFRVRGSGRIKLTFRWSLLP